MGSGCRPPPPHPVTLGVVGTVGTSWDPPHPVEVVWSVVCPWALGSSDRERESKRGTERTKRGDRKQAKTSKGAYQKTLKNKGKSVKKQTKAQRNFENNLESALGASKKWQAATMKPPGPSKSTWKRPSARQMHPEAPECQKVLKNKWNLSPRAKKY